MATAYGSEFYRRQSEGSARSAEQIVPIIMELVRPQSVIDVGCGVGTWLRAFQDRGIVDMLGVDGAWVEGAALRVSPDLFREIDLTKPFRLLRGFDLAVSLEVAEHLPPESAAGFIDSLVSLAPVVAFSAAIPHQGGVSHVNEQWPDYWARLFVERGFEVVDCIRRRVWNNPHVQFWYAQNLLVFVREDHRPRLPLLQSGPEETTLPLRIVHPRKYEQAIALYEEAKHDARKAGSRAVPGHPISAVWRRLARFVYPDSGTTS